MYCKICGKQIEEDSVYCSYCGKKQSSNIASEFNQSLSVEVDSPDIKTMPVIDNSDSENYSNEDMFIKFITYELSKYSIDTVEKFFDSDCTDKALFAAYSYYLFFCIKLKYPKKYLSLSIENIAEQLSSANSYLSKLELTSIILNNIESLNEEYHKKVEDSSININPLYRTNKLFFQLAGKTCESSIELAEFLVFSFDLISKFYIDNKSIGLKMDDESSLSSESIEVKSSATDFHNILDIKSLFLKIYIFIFSPIIIIYQSTFVFADLSYLATELWYYAFFQFLAYLMNFVIVYMLYKLKKFTYIAVLFKILISIVFMVIYISYGLDPIAPGVSVIVLIELFRKRKYFIK